jgi:hypothetical protein
VGGEFSLPAGTATFLLTDIELPTRNREADRAVVGPAVARHDELVDRAVADALVDASEIGLQASQVEVVDLPAEATHDLRGQAGVLTGRVCRHRVDEGTALRRVAIGLDPPGGDHRVTRQNTVVVEAEEVSAAGRDADHEQVAECVRVVGGVGTTARGRGVTSSGRPERG